MEKTKTIDEIFKQKKTLDEIFEYFVDHEDVDLYDPVFYAKQVIDALITERERLARIDELNEVMENYTFFDENFSDYMDIRIAELQHSQEADEKDD